MSLPDRPWHSYKLIAPSSPNGLALSEFILSCNFPQLSHDYPEFNKARNDRQSPAQFNAALTRSLLHLHFGLRLPSLPTDRLCPPIPNRANYCCWLRELVSSSHRDLERFASGKVSLNYRGIDIGTGVCAIYPLLLCTALFAKSHVWQNHHGTEEGGTDSHPPPRWKFLATDIDPIAVNSALTNVQANHLHDQICIAQVDSDCHPRQLDGQTQGPLFDAIQANSHMVPVSTSTATTEPEFDFVMTNPPFYSTDAEATALRADKRSRTSMSSNEAVYPPFGDRKGGDVGFIAAILGDSRFFSRRVTWYTALIARRSSLDWILRQLDALEGVWGNWGQIRSVEFRQGSSAEHDEGSIVEDGTASCSPRVRWGVAWTFERAVGRCSSCRVTSGTTSFTVRLNSDDIDLGSSVKTQWSQESMAPNGRSDVCAACREEVVSRLRTYFESLSEPLLKCSYRGCSDGGCVMALEERFFDSASSSSPPVPSREEDNPNLPYEGHFVLDAIVKVVDESQINYKDTSTIDIELHVGLELYAHTKTGLSLVDKIRGQMPGEIGRTNRRWRRFKTRIQEK